MLDRLFIRRLEREMPGWVVRGWLAPAGRDSILEDLAAREQKRRAPGLAFGVMGALLLGIGVVLFFAANWPALPRAAKLALIFAMLWASYGMAWILVRQDYRRFAEVLTLLGCLLFGAAILLVGQTYHLPADPPGGVLLWTLGTFVAAYLWPSGLTAVLGLGLTGIWVSLAAPEFDGLVFWPFFLVWAIPLPLAISRGWDGVRHAALLSLMFWILLTFVLIGDRLQLDIGSVLRFAVALGTAFVGLGAFVSAQLRLEDDGRLLVYYGLVLFASTLFPGVMPDAFGPIDLTRPSGAGLALATALALVAAAVSAALVRSWPMARLPWFCVAVGTAFLATGLIPPVAASQAGFALSFGVLVVWLGLIGLGYRLDDRFIVNIGFVLFAASLIHCYFTWFWPLLDRALFFMAGGVMVLGLGLLLERQRRRLIKRMESQPT